MAPALRREREHAYLAALEALAAGAAARRDHAAQRARRRRRSYDGYDADFNPVQGAFLLSGGAFTPTAEGIDTLGRGVRTGDNQCGFVLTR